MLIISFISVHFQICPLKFQNLCISSFSLSYFKKILLLWYQNLVIFPEDKIVLIAQGLAPYQLKSMIFLNYFLSIVAQEIHGTPISFLFEKSCH